MIVTLMSRVAPSNITKDSIAHPSMTCQRGGAALTFKGALVYANLRGDVTASSVLHQTMGIVNGTVMLGAHLYQISVGEGISDSSDDDDSGFTDTVVGKGVMNFSETICLTSHFNPILFSPFLLFPIPSLFSQPYSLPTLSSLSSPLSPFLPPPLPSHSLLSTPHHPISFFPTPLLSFSPPHTPFSLPLLSSPLPSPMYHISALLYIFTASSGN